MHDFMVARWHDILTMLVYEFSMEMLNGIKNAVMDLDILKMVILRGRMHEHPEF